MPSTGFKNGIYRLMLPFLSPSAGFSPIREISGHPLSDERGLVRIIRRNHVLGGAILLSSGSDQSLILTGSKIHSCAASDHIYYRVASITKMATAMVALRLSDEGLIDLKAPVTEYLPEIIRTEELRNVTLLHLLSHTSGLADPPGLDSLLESGKPVGTAVTGSRFAEPGSVFRYSNLAFGLAGCVLESVSGLPIGKLFQKKLFDPLGMNATMEGCSLPADRIMPVVRILPYRPENAMTVTKLGQVPLTVPDPLRHYGHTAGSMYTDISSLKKMIDCIRNGGAPILSSASASLMTRKHASYGLQSPTLSYGLGMLIVHDPALSESRILGHQGFAYGCADGAFWEENSGRIMIILNGGCSEARAGRLGLCNRDMLRWAFRKEIPQWTKSGK